MDIAAKAPGWQFRAITRKGTLTLGNDGKTAHVDWDLSSDRDIMSGFSYKGRGMELSDLTEYNGHILSPDDKTGILFEIKNNKALPWVILNSGPGNTTKGMKTEWLTIKGSFLYAGGHGVEYRDDKGIVFSEDQMWIKSRLRGTNLLITADERFNAFEIVRVGTLDHPERGFSAFAFVPGTNDNVIVALKSKGMDGKAPESFVTVFDIRGQIMMEDQKLGNNYKFEGIFFL
ncbi:Apyrase [Ancylostoma caninum]|uniref:Apyrase n=1 Tax=Ancylostoma caninum TaxID=29170 RepID=A0A368G6Q9_ANCCA|nr:Apyrase [Ancylostoma caninum]